MAKVKIPVIGTVGKAVRINPDATVGGQIGVDLRLPSGNVPTFKELAIALNAQLPPAPTTSATGAAPVAAPTGTVFESQIVDGDILARVAANEQITGAYNFVNGITSQSYDGILAGNLVDKDASETVTGIWTFNPGILALGAINILNTIPTIFMRETDAAADEVIWRFVINAGQFNFEACNDAVTVCNPIFTVERTGATVDSIDFPTALTATSYDGILAANLLDRTVNEIVTGRWDFESDGAAPQLCIVDSDSNGAATRAFIEYLGKGDVLTGRMGYLSASSGIFTIDNALPNAGIELTNAGVQKLRIDINGVFMSDDTTVTGTIFVDNTSGEKIVLRDTNSTGNAVLNFIAFKDMNDLRQGVVGFGSSGNDDLIVQTDAGFGDVILKPQGSNVLRASNTLVAISTALTALSYDGILAANLVDKTASETVTGIWTFNGGLLLPSLNIIDPIPMLFMRESDAAADEVIWRFVANAGQFNFEACNDAVTICNPIFTVERTGATVDSIDFPTALTATSYEGIAAANLVDRTAAGALVATSYNGILAANLLDKSAGETITGIWTFNPGILSLGAINIQTTIPTLFMRETDATADNVIWRFVINAEQFNFEVCNDAVTVCNPIFTVERTGTTVDSIDFPTALTAQSYSGIAAANLLDKTAAEIISGAYTYSGRLVTDDSTASRAGFNIPEGTAPSAPVDGDIWVTTTDILARINGVSESLIGAAGNVSATGTPLDNQLAVWINATTIEGVAGLTFDGTSLEATQFAGIAKANLLDKSAAEIVSGAWTFSTLNGPVFTGSGGPLIDSITPQLRFTETDAAADEGRWRFIADAGQFNFEMLNDAFTVAVPIFTVDRTGNTLDSFDIPTALTATSYDGILAANLLDKTALETITANWIIDVAGNGPHLIVRGGNVGTDIARFKRDVGANTSVSISGGNGEPQIKFDRNLGANQWAMGVDTDDQFVIGDALNINVNDLFVLKASGDLTVTSIGGITLANLLDKTAAETISGAYKFSSSGGLVSDPSSNNATVRAGANDQNLTIIFGTSFDNSKNPTIRGWGDTTATPNLLTLSVPATGVITLQGSGGIGTVDFTNIGTLTAGDTDALFKSYSGVLAANLLDKTSNETVTGVWTLSSGLNIGATDTTLSRFNAGRLQVEFKPIFSHIGTDFNSAHVTFSTSAPSGGEDGDVWYRYA